MLLKFFAYTRQDELLPTNWEIEHIFPQKWDDHYFDKSYSPDKIYEMIEHLGNKTPLEKKLNIKASNGYFHQKLIEYNKTKIAITKNIQKSNCNKDWSIEDITIRDMELYNTFNNVIGNWIKLGFKDEQNLSSKLTPEQIAAIELLKNSGFTVNK